MIELSPEQEAAWEGSRLDMRCRACGATCAASSWCFRCGSTDLDYRTHQEQSNGLPWCKAPVEGLTES